jgi:hypothetical protein
MQMPTGQVHHDFTASTLATSIRSSVPSPQTVDQIWQQPLSETPSTLQTSIVININSNGSTGRGILIGILSALGSAGFAFLVLGIFIFFRYTNRGRIILDRIGRPGEFDDEQAFAKEEAEALESMDEMQRTEYLRAKGTTFPCQSSIRANRYSSIHTSESTRDCTD